MKEKLREFLKTHSDLAFVGAVLLVVILVFSLSDAAGKGNVIRANSPPPQAAGQQAQARPQAPRPLVNGPLKVGAYKPVEPALSGRLYQEVVEVRPEEKGWKESFYLVLGSKEEFTRHYREQAATVTWPLAGRYARFRCGIEMPQPPENLEKYGVVAIEFYKDGAKVFERRISPSALVTSPVQVDIDLAGAQTLTLRVVLLPQGEWRGESSGIDIFWGKPFTFWLTNLEFVPAEGGDGGGQGN